jgi:hypothetical protein
MKTKLMLLATVLTLAAASAPADAARLVDNGGRPAAASKADLIRSELAKKLPQLKRAERKLPNLAKRERASRKIGR